LHKGLSLGKPKSIRVGQGPEFVNKTLDLWAHLYIMAFRRVVA